jgi:hypothetical protein
MNLPSNEERELFFLLATTGIRFLEHTYDVVPGNSGFGLRIVHADGALISFDLCKDEQAVIERARAALEEHMYDLILGRPTNYQVASTAWSKE